MIENVKCIEEYLSKFKKNRISLELFKKWDTEIELEVLNIHKTELEWILFKNKLIFVCLSEIRVLFFIRCALICIKKKYKIKKLSIF